MDLVDIGSSYFVLGGVLPKATTLSHIRVCGCLDIQQLSVSLIPPKKKTLCVKQILGVRLSSSPH